MHLYNGLNSTNKLSAWEEMNHLCYGWDGVDDVLVSAPNTGGGRKLFSTTSKQSSFWINIDIFIPTILEEWIINTSLTKPK